jgi:protein CpxP
MRAAMKLMTLAAICGAAAAGPVLAQPPGRGPGPGPGMRGGGGPPMAGMYGDPASYLDGLKARLGITSAQEPAWNAYADTVSGAATQMRAAHQSLYEAMGTATWQERRDMMNRMFESRQQAFDTVHTAAQKLLPSLTPEQQTTADGVLPGLREPGRGMTGRMGHRGPRTSP